MYVRTLHALVTSQVGCAANTIILFLNHRGCQPEVNKENCDCMAAHPTWEGYNLLVSWDGTNEFVLYIGL